ncbi:MAG: hypothetical protein Q7S77_02230 [Candidatus Staskawiczbacteria bacterium]|nr:hypothetical protein [Candidatus Staskawiczbacteria bacterium]
MRELLKINTMWVSILSIPFFVGLLIIFRFSPERQLQVLITASIVYVATAILHHFQDKTLTMEIIIEYILIAVLALLLLQGLLI